MNQTLLRVENAQKLVFNLFLKAGLELEKAENVTRILLEGELLGHRTHGLHLVMPYLQHLGKGSMTKSGNYAVLNSTPASELWDGKYLPGTWLVEKAVERAKTIADEYGSGTVVIQQSSHIACLAAYMEAATITGHMVILASSDPANATVAPFGGTQGAYSPNPLALGIPTESEPIIIDVSMSATSNGLINQKKQSGEMLEHEWLITADGEPSKNPIHFFDDPPATILPLGGLDSGYKGFALGIMIEAMTSALGGHGRLAKTDAWGASVYLQVINPDRFSGESYFKREMENLKQKCLANKAAHPDKPVRIPGQRGLELKQKQLKDGLNLREDTYAGLMALAKEFDLNS